MMMIEYKDNETYERDKAAIINMLINDGRRFEANLLKQSKWIGKADVSNAEGIRPIPVVRDKYDQLIKNYDFRDWLVKLNEEYREAIEQIIVEDKTLAAEELQDLITVCTSMLEWLGFNEAARDKLTLQINEKNRKRGYHNQKY